MTTKKRSSSKIAPLRKKVVTQKRTKKASVKKSVKTSKKVSTKKVPHLPYQTPRGMRDILPSEQIYWTHIERVLCKAVQEFGFQRIIIPTVEFTPLFTRSVGEGTDIVEKELYTFTSRGGDNLSLRPEMTAGIVRAYIQNGMQVWPKPVKLFSQGPLFRYDRPQEGRYREHYQASFEVFGENDPIMDAQLIQMAHRVLTAVGIKSIQFQVNTLGSTEDKKEYRKLLVSYLKSKQVKLCGDCKRRLTMNPLRVLDCKEERCSQVVFGAPQSIDHLSQESHDHFKYLLEYLDELEVPYEINPRLVRGLDYYTETVFEIWADGDAGKKSALGGGGRYNDLVKQLGGESTPALGFGLGLDRTILQMKKEKTRMHQAPKPRVFLAQLGEMAKKKSLRLFATLEKNGILLAESFGRGGLKAQLRQASKLGVDVTIILGQKEALDETVIVKDMLSGSQETVTQERVVDIVKKLLKNNGTVKALRSK